MAFATFAAASSLTASEASTYRLARPIRACTSTTRPDATVGQIIFETDTDRIYKFDGTEWIEIPRGGPWRKVT